MIGVKSYAEKAVDAVERVKAALARSNRRLVEHEARRPAGDDADASYSWKRERRDLEDRVASDKDALDFAEARAEQALVEARDREAIAANIAEERRAAADGKLIREAEALVEKLAAKLADIEASRERTDQINANRGDLPFVEDAETRIRRRPGQLVPAITEKQKVWMDADGSRFGDRLRWDVPLGKYVECPDRKLVEIDVVIRPELQLPPIMPDRLADAIRLVNLAGEQVWPPR